MSGPESYERVWNFRPLASPLELYRKGDYYQEHFFADMLQYNLSPDCQSTTKVIAQINIACLFIDGVLNHKESRGEADKDFSYKRAAASLMSFVTEQAGKVPIRQGQLDFLNSIVADIKEENGKQICIAASYGFIENRFAACGFRSSEATYQCKAFRREARRYPFSSSVCWERLKQIILMEFADELIYEQSPTLTKHWQVGSLPLALPVRVIDIRPIDDSKAPKNGLWRKPQGRLCGTRPLGGSSCQSWMRESLRDSNASPVAEAPPNPYDAIAINASSGSGSSKSARFTPRGIRIGTRSPRLKKQSPSLGTQTITISASASPGTKHGILSGDLAFAPVPVVLEHAYIGAMVMCRAVWAETDGLSQMETSGIGVPIVISILWTMVDILAVFTGIRVRGGFIHRREETRRRMKHTANFRVPRHGLTRPGTTNTDTNGARGTKDFTIGVLRQLGHKNINVTSKPRDLGTNVAAVNDSPRV
ncbi:hypothetical protein GQX73_g6644 [Xylaria multiplex]|uniref:Uncharacterized protein n=1 Tax=Xylaria multiplex TaxID=323545 RepID=A0A7C8IPJ7_9PEZI|nr:hypothetical protein GQX73_g6644 [Xylaria multiplex]